eukprot:scaffold17249_cov126-Isochrysis_galbana.AAC.5
MYAAREAFSGESERVERAALRTRRSSSTTEELKEDKSTSHRYDHASRAAIASHTLTSATRLASVPRHVSSRRSLCRMRSLTIRRSRGTTPCATIKLEASAFVLRSQIRHAASTRAASLADVTSSTSSGSNALICERINAGSTAGGEDIFHFSRFFLGDAVNKS